jgi:hypothetical protein
MHTKTKRQKKAVQKKKKDRVQNSEHDLEEEV